MKKILCFAISFYFLVLFQIGFLAHFSWKGFTPNLVLVLVAFFSFLRTSDSGLKNDSGILAALFGGFFLDVFSSGFIGIWTAGLLGFSIFIKFILKKYARIPGKTYGNLF